MTNQYLPPAAHRLAVNGPSVCCCTSSERLIGRGAGSSDDPATALHEHPCSDATDFHLEDKNVFALQV